MKRVAVKLGVVCAVIVASIATPVAVQRHAGVRVREKSAALCQQADRLTELTAENRRLSNLVAQANPPLSDEQFRELMRLRGEVGILREQTNAVRRLQEENRRLEARLTSSQDRPARMTRVEFEQELMTETREAMRNICLELPLALQRYASDHTNQAPADLLKLRNCAPFSGEPVVGLYSFKFVSDPPPVVVPADALILRETGSHRKPDGMWARFYAYGDGRIVEATSDDGNFDAWEKQQGNPPSASR